MKVLKSQVDKVYKIYCTKYVFNEFDEGISPTTEKREQ